MFDKGTLKVQVEFTNGTSSFVEEITPQDENGLKYWVKGRLAQLNFSTEVEAKFPTGSTVDVSTPVVTPPTPTAEAIAQEAWLVNYRKWTKIKTTLIDTGILTGNETKLATLKAKVQSDFLPAYLDII